MNLNIEELNDLLNDIWNFHLVLFGVALSIFTLLYSFILSKREELKSIADQVKAGDKSPLLIQRESFAKKYIKRLKSINDHAAVTIVITFILFFASWVTRRLIPDNFFEAKRVVFYVIATITALVICYCIHLFFKLYRHYKSETKI